MAGFLDVLLRGLILVLTGIALGGAAWLRLVVRAEPHVKPDGPTVLALTTIGAAAVGVAAAQTAVVMVSFGAVGTTHGDVLATEFFTTTFALTATARVVWALGLALLARRMAEGAAGRVAWTALFVGATALVASSAIVSHAVARVEYRWLLLALDGAHQLAAAVWVGGLAHLALYAAWRRRHASLMGTRPELDVHAAAPVVRRFSTLAFRAMATLVLAGAALTWMYVGEPSALVGTAYGVMVLSKVTLLLAALALAYANMRAVHVASGEPDTRLFRFAEAELGLGITILFAAASLTSLPPSVDVTIDRATVGEVAARFVPAPPRLTSPPIDELIRTADPLMERQISRKPVERAWSEYNHHWAGFFVVTMGALAILERLGLRVARHWPLVFFGMATFLFVRNDPRAWPLGPAGFWESFSLPDVLQHRTFVLLIVAFGVFEWMVRTERLAVRPWAYVFPLLCAVGGGLLLTHSHAMFNLKDEFLAEVTHAPLGILGAFAGWGRWLELRLPEAGRWPAWTWRVCFTAVGLLLLFYREG
ncbi:MAG TPA: CopD family protein [Methylomirabilota bacterium]|nr:CopD family protein [Methylomirabilota bacterium]